MTPSINDAQRDQRRQQILQAAIALFLQQGYEKTSVSDVVRKAGIAQGTFYLYYPSKEHLLFDLAGVFAGQMVEHAMSRVEPQAPPLLRIEQAIYALADYMRQQGEVIALFHTASAATLLREPGAVASSMQAMLQPLVEWIEEGMRAGSIRPVDARQAAYLVFTLGHEVLETAFLLGSPANLDDVLPGLVDFINHALASPAKQKE